MELDKLKDTWEKVSEIDTKPSDEQILKLLKSSKNIWSRIIIKEKIGFIIAFIFCPLCYLLTSVLKNEFRYIFFMIFVYMAVMTIWQLFKWRYLKKLDIINSDILSISKYINKYRNFCIYEWIMIIIWLIMFNSVLFMPTPSNFSMNRYALIAGSLLSIAVFAFLFARVRYDITIGKIKRNLKEIKAFEKEE